MYAPSTTVLSAILGLATLFTGSAAAIAIAAPQPDSAPALETRKWRSNIDMAQACREQYNDRYTVAKNGDKCNAWKCKGEEGKEGGINVDLYCVNRFGGDAYASCGGVVPTTGSAMTAPRCI